VLIEARKCRFCGYRFEACCLVSVGGDVRRRGEGPDRAAS
jgi:hypothetical protein